MALRFPRSLRPAMACRPLLPSKHLSFPSFAICNFPIYFNGFRKNSSSALHSPAPISDRFFGIGRSCFSWDDILRVSQLYPGDSSQDLRGFFEKIIICNRGSEMRSQFTPLVIQDQILGYIHCGFADHLRRFQDVIIFHKERINGSHFDGHLTLPPIIKTPEDMTSAIASVIECLGEELIPGIRNELYPAVSVFGTPAYFSIERAAVPYFGIKAYGVHMNGYVEREGQKLLWVGKRSQKKQTYPGMLDHLVAGGLPHGMTCKENLMKECEEEAGIPQCISKEAIPVGAISYSDIDGHRFKRDVIFCYDLKLHEDFMPTNQDGEVEDFKLLPVGLVANIIRKTHFFKPNCSLVIIDFLFRHGYINPEESGYLKLLQSLRGGDCT